MTRRLALLLPIALSPLPGCDDAPGPATPGVKLGTPSDSKPAPAPVADPGKPREILGKRTTDIKDADKEMKTTGAVKADTRVVSSDPITVAGGAYVSAIGQTAIGNIKHAVDLYQAETGAYPKTHQEFMEQIIQKNSIALPTLPYYREYAYDVNTHQLNVIEYPAKKAAGDARRP